MSFFVRDAPMKWWQKKEQIQKLRQEGLSYRELIAQLPFKVAKGTVSRWCREIELTPEQLDRLDGLRREGSYRSGFAGAKANQRRRAAEIEAIKVKARSEVPELSQKELWVAGLMLYWAEGSKGTRVEITNSDPSLIRFMMKWLRVFCRVPEEKFRVYLHLHTGQDEEAMKTFWSQVTGIPLVQFRKSYVKKEGTGHRKNILYNGTIKIAVCNKDLLHRIQGWIEGFSERIFGAVSSAGRAPAS